MEFIFLYIYIYFLNSFEVIDIILDKHKCQYKKWEPVHGTKFLYQIYFTNEKNVTQFDKYICTYMCVACVLGCGVMWCGVQGI